MKTARERLQESPALTAAVEAQLKAGLLAQIGLPAAGQGGPPEAGGSGEGRRVDLLESIRSDDALEAIVQRVGRPPLLIQNDRVVLGAEIDGDLVDFPPGTDARIRGTEKFIPSVGRVEFTNHHRAWGGTGWVIAAEGRDRIVVTNRHVAGLVARRSADGQGVFLRGPSQIRYGASLDFREEYVSLAADARPFTVVAVPYLADMTGPDVALLRITGEHLPSPLPLADTEAGVDDLVALIGYPAHDDRNDADVMAAYFRDLYNVKRYAPGKVLQALGPGSALSHDCTSLGGNSGSPLIRLTDGKVVGLHFAGHYGRFNSAVGAATLRHLLDGHHQLLSIRPTGDDSTEAAGDGVHHPDELRDREGYDPGFLGHGELAAPWPGLTATAEADLVRPSDERPDQPYEIRYTHFGIRFSRSRRQPMMTAVNIDGRHVVPIKRGRDKWFRDARIALGLQLGKTDYAHPEIDRGHMVRRQDPNWDDSPAAQGTEPGMSVIAQRANDDTFHYTNAAVQHGDLNSSSQLWRGLEDYVLESTQTHGFRACVFTGPVTREDDSEIGPGVIAPREFWKLVVMRGADSHRLHATAYLLSQGELIRDLLERRSRTEAVEGFVLGAYRTFQVSVADLADATGFDLSRYVPHDPLGAPSEEGPRQGEPVFVPLESAQEMVL